METDSVQLDHNGTCIDEIFPEQLLPPDSPGIIDIFGDPQVLPRVGDEYQVEIPSMITESERLQLLKNPADTEVTFDVSHSFLMGLPIPLMWIDDELKSHKKEGEGFNNNPDGSVKENGSLGYKISKKSQLNSNRRGLQVKVESSDVGLENEEELNSPNFEHTMVGKANLDQMDRSKSGCLVPGLLVGDTWSEFEVDSFLLGLYIFERNLVQVKRFMESKNMGEILSFYYGKFFKTDAHQRWLYCRKMKSKKCIFGPRIFTGWRQQELLSRMLPHVPEEAQNILVEVSKAFAEGRTSLEEYVSALKTTADINILIKAVGIGKGKDDLTGLATEPIKTNQIFSVRPEIPIGKACSSLTYGDIIKFLTGDFRLSKARSNDLFWEAVWPRLLARGWHSEQPKNQGFAGSKNYLVFLMPGVNKFSRRKLVKGDHYFDSVSDVLSKVAAEPKLLELEDEEPGLVSCKEGIRWEPEPILDQDDPSDHGRHCYLKPRISTSNPNIMKFTVVDTSLAHGEKSSKVRELRSLPIETKNTSNVSSLSKEVEGDSSEDSVDEPDSADMSLKVQKKTNSSNHAKDILDHSSSDQKMQINGSEAAKKSLENHHDQDTSTSNDKQTRRTIKQQFSRRVKPGHSNFLAPLMKRRRLTACVKAETSRSMENFMLDPELKQVEPNCMLNSPDACKSVVSLVGSSQEKVLSSGSLAVGILEEESSDILHGISDGIKMSPEKIEKPHPRPLIDLNLPQIPSDSENGEFCRMEVDENQGDPNANGSFFPSDSHKLIEDSKSLRTSAYVNDAEQQPIVNPRRQSTRNRPLTTKALEALASGFLSTKRRRKDTKSQTRENSVPRPSRKAHSRAIVTSNSGSTDNGVVESKEESGVDGSWNGKTNMINESLAETERKAAQELLGISKAAYHPEALNFKDD
uniref:SANT domain-containing protein n=1 Tax=Davidia involucrata TaxID=16924 RepID=A0A5B6ZUT8_DAVIN